MSNYLMSVLGTRSAMLMLAGSPLPPSSPSSASSAASSAGWMPRVGAGAFSPFTFNQINKLCTLTILNKTISQIYQWKFNHFSPGHYNIFSKGSSTLWMKVQKYLCLTGIKKIDSSYQNQSTWQPSTLILVRFTWNELLW